MNFGLTARMYRNNAREGVAIGLEHPQQPGRLPAYPQSWRTNLISSTSWPGRNGFSAGPESEDDSSLVMQKPRQRGQSVRVIFYDNDNDEVNRARLTSCRMSAASNLRRLLWAIAHIVPTALAWT
jgi:hypothetical protein